MLNTEYPQTVAMERENIELEHLNARDDNETVESSPNDNNTVEFCPNDNDTVEFSPNVELEHLNARDDNEIIESSPDFNDTVESSPSAKNEISRWSVVDFGMISKLLKVILVNISDRLCAVITIIITTLISIADTVTDFVVAFTLIFAKHYNWAIAVIVIDYLPSWNILVHNLTSSRWRRFKDAKERFATLIFLLLSPFSMALFHLRWIAKFETSDQDTFDFLHHNSRLSNILCGSFESPVQIILLIILYGREKLDSPFDDSSSCFTDTIGRQLCLGILPGILSMLNSIVSLLKASLEISEGKSFEDKIYILIYAFTNYVFRLPSIALLILYFNEWAAAILAVILMANFIVIIRYDKEKRKDFSVFSSAIIASVSPFISSDQTNLYARKDIQRVLPTDDESETHRKKLSALVSMVTTPLLLMGNITLLLLLEYTKDFKYSDDIKIEKLTVTSLLVKFFLPMGLITMLVNYLYGMHVSKDSNVVKYFFRCSVLILLFFGALATSGVAMSELLGRQQVNSTINLQPNMTNKSKF